jgi:VWFA-related protein
MVSGRQLCAFLILSYSAIALAQQPSQPAQPAQATQPAAPAASAAPSNRITLDMVVTSKNGTRVSGLTEQDFTIVDNKAPQTITSFRALSGPDQPIEVILLIDGVNTGYSTVSYERGEIDKFLQANGGALPYPTQIAVFTDTGTQIQQGFSKDGHALANLLDHYTVSLRAIGRSAGFYGATDRLQLSLKTIGQLAAFANTLPGRKILLWISPGWPILSGPDVELSTKQQEYIFDMISDLSTGLRKARITLYSIDPTGRAFLRAFASRSSRSSAISHCRCSPSSRAVWR